MSDTTKNTSGEKINAEALQALKIAFSYMPNTRDVTSYDYGERVDKVKGDIETVREMLLLNDVDPDEVYDEVNPDIAPDSSY